MSDFKLSERSEQRLIGVDLRLHEVIELALKLTKIDFGIPQYGGRRTPEEQAALYRANRSQRDGYSKKSYHQTGLAVDLYAYIDGKASWEPKHLAMVACAMLQAASILGYQLECGILWESRGPTDGIPYGWDCGHFQLLDND